MLGHLLPALPPSRSSDSETGSTSGPQLDMRLLLFGIGDDVQLLVLVFVLIFEVYSFKNSNRYKKNAIVHSDKYMLHFQHPHGVLPKRLSAVKCQPESEPSRYNSIFTAFPKPPLASSSGRRRDVKALWGWFFLRDGRNRDTVHPAEGWSLPEQFLQLPQVPFRRPGPAPPPVRPGDFAPSRSVPDAGPGPVSSLENTLPGPAHLHGHARYSPVRPLHWLTATPGLEN
jgi:hypothetical protein